jgi:hypothetical protein
MQGDFQQELKRQFSTMEGPIGWDLAEKTFLEVCLTEEERLKNMQAMANIGREKRETFQKYANRIDRNARIYSIQDNNDMVIHQLIRSINSNEYNLLLFKYQAQEPEATTFTSITTFCSYLKILHGPDDALQGARTTTTTPAYGQPNHTQQFPFLNNHGSTYGNRNNRGSRAGYHQRADNSNKILPQF